MPARTASGMALARRCAAAAARFGALAALALSAAACLRPAPAVAAPAFPLKGIVVWPDEARDHPELADSISLEFLYATPSALVTGAAADGSPKIDWGPLDKTLDDIASRGHQAIVRFRYEYPGEKLAEFPGKRGATGVPKFVKALPGYHETFSQNPGGDGPTYYADWSHPGLERFTVSFFRELAKRYDADPRLAFLEVGFGHWSEYHTHGTPVKLGKNFPSKAFQEGFMRMLAREFRQTPWCVSIDAAQTKYSDLAADASLSELPFGLFDDSFMHAEHDHSQGEGWNEDCWAAFGADRWRRAVCGGEISYYDRRDQREFLSPKGVHGITWEAAAAKYHITFMIGNDSVEGKFATPERLLSAARACGYSFRLVDARRERGKPSIVAEVANDGVAPLYHDAHLVLDCAMGGGEAMATPKSSESLRGLQPGETRLFHIEFKGVPDMDSIRVVSPKLLPGASIPLSR